MKREDDMQSGDLGDGLGLKPGGIVIPPENDKLGGPYDCSTATVCWKCQRKTAKNEEPPTNDIDYVCQAGNIALGTSIRTQRRVFQKELQEIFPSKSGRICTCKCAPLLMRRHSSGGGEGDGSFIEQSHKKSSSANKAVISSTSESVGDKNVISDTLKKAQQDAELLYNNMEICQSQLEGKLRAIKILQTQALAADISKSSEGMEYVDCLVKELEQLQFELNYRQNVLLDTDRSWEEKFDRICCENAALMATVKARGVEVDKLRAELAVLKSERDELLTVVSTKDELVFKDNSYSSVSHNGNTTLAELAMLDACHCGHDVPCMCARKCAAEQTEIQALKQELEQWKRKHNDACLLADVYKAAFEEQLQRTRHSSSTSPTSSNGQTTSKTCSGKNLINWIDDRQRCTASNFNSHKTQNDQSSLDPGFPHSVDIIRSIADMLKESDNKGSEEKRIALQLLESRTSSLKCSFPSSVIQS